MRCRMAKNKMTNAKRKYLLAALNARVSAPERDVMLPGPTAERDFIELEGEDLESLFHSSGLLVRQDRPVLAYVLNQAIIKTPDDFLRMSPETCNKVHFSVCDTLLRKQEEGDVKTRYRITSSVRNKYLIDVLGRGHNAIEVMADLHTCKNCLGLLEYEGYDSAVPRSERMHIILSFDAKHAILEL